MSIKVTLRNKKAVARELSKYESERSKKTLKAMQTTGLVVQSKAKIRVPVDTGNLRASITSKNLQTTVIIQAGAGTQSVEYAGFVEHGTSKMPARPYFFNSWEEERGKLIKKINQIFR